MQHNFFLERSYDFGLSMLDTFLEIIILLKTWNKQNQMKILCFFTRLYIPFQLSLYLYLILRVIQPLLQIWFRKILEHWKVWIWRPLEWRKQVRLFSTDVGLSWQHYNIQRAFIRNKSNISFEVLIWLLTFFGQNSHLIQKGIIHKPRGQFFA